jgi:hypothetical protein
MDAFDVYLRGRLIGLDTMNAGKADPLETLEAIAGAIYADMERYGHVAAWNR